MRNACHRCRAGCQALLGVVTMTTQHPLNAQAVRLESSLAILIARRNVREHRADTRFVIRRTVGALRVLRSVSVV
jgi:hypothetical protein